MRKLKNEELNRLSADEYKFAEKTPIIIVLDNVRSALNVGSIFRTCDAFRIEALYLCGITGKPPDREINKTAIGATETVEWKYFQGLPIPMAAYLLATTVIFYEHLYAIQPKENFPVFFLTIGLALLMVSNIPYRSLKKVALGERLPFFVLVLVVAVLVLFALRPPLTLWIGSLLYVASGLAEGAWRLVFSKRGVEVPHESPVYILPARDSNIRKNGKN